jgi:hypothetical protein
MRPRSGQAVGLAQGVEQPRRRLDQIAGFRQGQPALDRAEADQDSRRSRLLVAFSRTMASGA